MEELSEIGAIWKAETNRALKSGRGLVLLVLFVLFVGLALTIVGTVNHRINAQLDERLATAGADPHQMSEQLLGQKKQFLKMFVTEDEAMLESLAAIPFVLLVVFKLTLRFVPLLIALMGFDQIAGEVGPKSIRYLVVRARRNSIIVGKLLSQLTVFALLLSVCTVLMVLVAKVLNADFSTGVAALWCLKLIVASLVLSLAYLALTALFSALVKQGSVSLVLNIIALFAIWFVALVGEALRFPNEMTPDNPLTQLKPESWFAYLRYASVWHFGDDLLHPHWSRFLAAATVHVGYGLVFLGLAQLALKRRDL